MVVLKDGSLYLIHLVLSPVCFAHAAARIESWKYCSTMIQFGSRLVDAILSTSFILSERMLSVKYFSIRKEPMGAAHVAPKPAFSTTMAIAIFGSSLGAKQTNIELFLSLALLPEIIRYVSAVPVFAQILIPGTFAALAVPVSTTSCIPVATTSYKLSGICVNTSCFTMNLLNTVSSSLCPSILSTKCGVKKYPLFAMMHIEFAICKGVFKILSWPIPSVTIVHEFHE